MKKVIIILSLLFVNSCIYSQFAPHPPGSVVTHPELNKFVGTWRWCNSTDTLIVKLYKQMISYPEPLNYSEEHLIGWHKYIKGDSIVESCIQYAGQPFMDVESSIYGGNKNDTLVKASFYDLSMDKDFDLFLSMTNLSYNIMRWKMRNPGGIKPNNYNWGATLPFNLLLTKQ